MASIAYVILKSSFSSFPLGENTLLVKCISLNFFKYFLSANEIYWDLDFTTKKRGGNC